VLYVHVHICMHSACVCVRVCVVYVCEYIYMHVCAKPQVVCVYVCVCARAHVKRDLYIFKIWEIA